MIGFFKKKVNQSAIVVDVEQNEKSDDEMMQFSSEYNADEIKPSSVKDKSVLCSPMINLNLSAVSG